jgi:PAS domain S-box-containing protein
MRGEGPSPIAGLRELLGYSPKASRAAQQPEARLAETERVLEFILRTSATGVVISNPDTAVIYEVNDAFCRFTGRSRTELLSGSAIGVWQDPLDCDAMIAEVRRSGIAENITSRVRWPDGTVRLGEATARFISLAGTRRLLATLDDVTEQHRLDDERAAGVTAYRAVTQLAVLLLGGQPVLKSIGSVLPELRRSGGFQTALLWNVKLGRPAAADGDKPPRELSGELLRGQPLPDSVVVRLGPARAATGWAVRWPRLATRSSCSVRHRTRRQPRRCSPGYSPTSPSWHLRPADASTTGQREGRGFKQRTGVDRRPDPDRRQARHEQIALGHNLLLSRVTSAIRPTRARARPRR